MNLQQRVAMAQARASAGYRASVVVEGRQGYEIWIWEPHAREERIVMVNGSPVAAANCENVSQARALAQRWERGEVQF